MMEVLATVSGIVGIVDVLSRSIIKLHDIMGKLTDANITLAALIGELTATKIALESLNTCLRRHEGIERHHELV